MGGHPGGFWDKPFSISHFYHTKVKMKEVFWYPFFPTFSNRFITSQILRVQHQTWELPFSFQCFDPIKQNKKPELYM
jgi:hypothetical protein